MELEKQVCSLKLAKRLKDLGLMQEALYHWQPSQFVPGKLIVVAEGAEDWSDDVESYAAFTVAELGEMLPKEENIVCMLFANGKCQYAIQDDVKYQDGGIQSSRWGAAGTCVSGDTEADARASVLIYLLENKLIPPL